MEIILNYKNGDYVLEKVEDNKIKRTNNQQKINSIINNVKISAINATYYDKFIRLYFGDDRYIVLKDLEKNKDLELYSIVLNCINENTRVIRNVRNINKIKLKAITALTIATLSMASVSSISKNDNQIINNSIETISPVDISSATQIPTITESVEFVPESVITEMSEPVITETPKINETKDFEDRFTESMLIRTSNSNSEGINLATGFSEYFCNKVLECSKGEIWKFMDKYGKQFGVDPYLTLAICYNESNLLHERTIPGGKSYNGYAVGIGQHENPNGTNKVVAFNYETNQYETEIISMQNACDLEKNIKMTTMLLQNKLKKYNNNIYAAVQSYNYGDSVMDLILNQYGSERRLSVDEVLNDYKDTGWMKNVEYFHNNPQKFLSNWKYKTYGDDKYVKKVMGYYIGTESINLLPDGSKVSTNLVTLENTYEVKSR